MAKRLQVVGLKWVEDVPDLDGFLLCLKYVSLKRHEILVKFVLNLRLSLKVRHPPVIHRSRFDMNDLQVLKSGDTRENLEDKGAVVTPSLPPGLRYDYS